MMVLMNDGGRRRRGWGAVRQSVVLAGLWAVSAVCGSAGPIGFAAENGEDGTAEWRQFGAVPAGRIEEITSSGITEAWQFELWETDAPIEELLSGVVVVGGYSIPTPAPITYNWGSSSDHDSAWAQYVAASNALRGLNAEGLPLANGTTGTSATRRAATYERGDGRISFLRAGSMDQVLIWSEFLQGPAVPLASAVPPVAASLSVSRSYRLAGNPAAPFAAFAMAEPAPVPEPGSLVLGAIGLLAASVLRKRQQY
jgi:hypothetical protein